MIQGIYSVLDAVINWTLHNKVKEVMVLDGIPVEGLPDPKRTPIILSSDGRKADEANLIHDYNVDVTKKEEVDDATSVYPSCWPLCQDWLAEFCPLVCQMELLRKSYSYMQLEGYRTQRGQPF